MTPTCVECGRPSAGDADLCPDHVRERRALGAAAALAGLTFAEEAAGRLSVDLADARRLVEAVAHSRRGNAPKIHDMLDALDGEGGDATRDACALCRPNGRRPLGPGEAECAGECCAEATDRCDLCGRPGRLHRVRRIGGAHDWLCGLCYHVPQGWGHDNHGLLTALALVREAIVAEIRGVAPRKD